MGLRNAGAAPTKYAGIQVQTSSLGVQIPICWGTCRASVNLVWYGAFDAIATKVSGAKGATITGYNYTASIVVAICEGPIIDLPTVWVDGKGYASGNAAPGSAGSYLIASGAITANSATAVSQAGLGFYTGEIGQSVWPYLTSSFPSQAIGYSGLCIAFAENYPLDSDAGTPQHSFEVQSAYTLQSSLRLPDANPQPVLADFFQNARYGLPNWGADLLDATTWGVYSTMALAYNLLVSPVIDQERQASDFLTEMMTATNSDLFWSEGLLKVCCYADEAATANGATFTPDLTPVYNLDEDDFLPKSDGDDALFVDIQDQSDAYNIVRMEFLDRTNSYAASIATASDAANISEYGRRLMDPTTIHVMCDPNVAQASAQLFLQRTLYIRKSWKFTVDWRFALVEPGDILTLTKTAMGLDAYGVRVTGIDEDEDGLLEFTCEDLLVGVSNAPTYAVQVPGGKVLNTNVDPGGVEAQLLDNPNTFNAGWTNAALTLTAGAATDPYYGESIAWSLVPTTANTDHYLLQSVASTFAGANYTFSCWFKANGYDFVQLFVVDSGSADQAWAVFNLSTGEIVAQGAAGSGVLIGASITAWGGGWYRCSVTGQIPNAPVGAQAVVLNNAQAFFYAGDGSSGVLAFGAQLTQGVDVRAAWVNSPFGPLMFNPPSVLTPGGVETWAAVAGGEFFGGANVWLSLDGGSTYQQVGQLPAGSARFGFLTTLTNATPDPDTIDGFSVDLSPSDGVLTGAADAVADQSGTLCLVDAELVAFSAATLTGPSQYNLGTYLRRGVLNTAIASHSVDAPFIRLDDAIFTFPYFATNFGQTVYAKFQPYNLWGRGTTPLSDCNAYPLTPIPTGSRPPSSSAWTATGTAVSNNGTSFPAIVVSGSSDNPSATGIEFDYRQTGTSAWNVGGLANALATQFTIAPLAPNQYYDISVLYLVNGIPSTREIVATGIQAGAFMTPGTGSGGPSPGAILLSDQAPGSGKTFEMPAGSAYSHVDILLVGVAGSGSYDSGGGKGSLYDTGGGGGMSVVVASFPVTPGTTTLTYTLPAAVGTNTTCTATGLSLTASSGTSASGASEGVGGSTSGITNSATGSSSLTNHAGHNGALTDTWDGGGAWLPSSPASSITSGGYTDNTSDNTPGSLAGQGGSGSYLSGIHAGGGCQLLVVARA